jgi:lipoprotein-releasing system ATP-binding protein
MSKILQAVNIHKSYRELATQLHVVKGVDLNVNEGEVVCIVGPSGAGKSTLLHMLGGLDVPDDGQILFEGEDLYRFKDADRAQIRNRKIGFIFQFYHLLAEFSALENVILPLMIKDDVRKNKDLEEKGMQLLDQVGLKERAQHKPKQLSGGEQQRVAIARALVNNPRVVFCDEPTGNLDSQNSQLVTELLMEFNAKNKQTFVIVTHDEQMARVSHRRVSMKDGIFVK